MNLWQDLIPLESLQCFSLALKAASVRGKRKNIILSFPSQLEKVSPAMLFPAVIISRNFLHLSRKCWAFKGKRAQFWLFRQDLSKAVVYESFCFPKSAAPKAERRWTCWVEMKCAYNSRADALLSFRDTCSLNLLGASKTFPDFPKSRRCFQVPLAQRLLSLFPTSHPNKTSFNWCSWAHVFLGYLRAGQSGARSVPSHGKE